MQAMRDQDDPPHRLAMTRKPLRAHATIKPSTCRKPWQGFTAFRKQSICRAFKPDLPTNGSARGGTVELGQITTIRNGRPSRRARRNPLPPDRAPTESRKLGRHARALSPFSPPSTCAPAKCPAGPGRPGTLQTTYGDDPRVWAERWKSEEANGCM